MKYFKFIFFILCLSALSKTELLKSFVLQKDQTCSGALLEYLNKEQSDIISPSFSLQYNRRQDVMGGYALICQKNRNAHLFYISKTGNSDTEQSFITNYLFEKYKEQSYINPQNEKASPNKFLLKPTINRSNKFENDDELSIYTLKSPCAVCASMYKKLSSAFPNMKINVYYTGIFKFYDPSILKKDYVIKTLIYKDCYQKVIRKLIMGLDDVHKEMKLNKKQFLEHGDAMLSCMNDETIKFVLSVGKNNLQFFRIKVHEEYLNYLNSVMDLIS